MSADSRPSTWPFAAEAPAFLQRHYDALRRGSGITDDVIRERGYRSILGKQELADLGFSPAQRRPPGLLLPVWTPDGQNPLYVYRPDLPRSDARGRPLKYEMPAGARVRLDVPPRCRAALGDPSVPLWITEGIKKADALASVGLCAIALLGVWNFKGKNPVGGVALLADFDCLALNGRSVVIVYDSDVSRKPQVHAALDRLVEHLCRKGATVGVISLPDGQDKDGKPVKTGVDDYLLSHTVADLEALAQDPAVAPAGRDGETPPGPPQPRLTLREDPPWPEPVDGAGLLSVIESFLSRYVVLPFGAALAVAVWAMTTYVLDAFDAHPYLVVASPVKQCGKTRLLELLDALCWRAVRAAGISEAALFRLIGAACPTLLIDEAQALRDRDERSAALHDLLCAGNRRGACVYRVGGPNHDRLDAFPVFAAKALAAIGGVSDIITDRAIEIRMRRRAPGEAIARFFFATTEEQAVPVRQQLVRWARDHLSEIRTVYRTETPPDLLADREAENWAPLFAVVRVADPASLHRLEEAARALTGAKAEGATPSAGLRLLADIHDVFVEVDTDRLSTSALLEALHAREESGWREWHHGRPLTPRGLADLLKPFGVRPAQVWYQGRNEKGYHREAFADVWSRYPLNTHADRARRLEPDHNAAFGDFPGARDTDGLASGKRPEPPPGLESSLLAFQKPEGGSEAGRETVHDDGRRVAVLRAGEVLKWPPLPYAPGVSIAPGRDAWLVFLRANSDETVVKAWRALERLSAGGSL